MQGEMSLGLFDRSSTTSDAVGRLVGVLCQQERSRVSLQRKKKDKNPFSSNKAFVSPYSCDLIPTGTESVFPCLTCSRTWLLLRPYVRREGEKNMIGSKNMPVLTQQPAILGLFIQLEEALLAKVHLTKRDFLILKMCSCNSFSYREENSFSPGRGSSRR